MASPVRIAVKCGEDIHYLDLDLPSLHMVPMDHLTVSWDTFEALEEIGGDPPECWKICRAFNDLTTPYKANPEEFWKLINTITGLYGADFKGLHR